LAFRARFVDFVGIVDFVEQPAVGSQSSNVTPGVARFLAFLPLSLLVEYSSFAWHPAAHIRATQQPSTL